MVSINYATKEVCCKIVYYGPGLSGKTTNLQYVHEKTPNQTRGKLISLATEADRTLYFDFLPINLGSINGFAAKFQLYTVPGQVYYNATRKLVLRGVDGVVFIADAQADKIDDNLESLSNLKENLEEYGYDVTDLPIVIQYNKTDLPTAMNIAELDEKLNTLGWPSFASAAVKGEGVFDTLKSIMKLVLEKARSGGSKSAEGKAPPAAKRTQKAQAPPRRSAAEQTATVESSQSEPVEDSAAAESVGSGSNAASRFPGAPTVGSVAPAPAAVGTAEVPTQKLGRPPGDSTKAASIFGRPRGGGGGRARKLGGSGSVSLKGSGGIPTAQIRPKSASIPPRREAADMDSTDKLTRAKGVSGASPAPAASEATRMQSVQTDIPGHDPLEQAPKTVKKKSGFFRRLFGS